MQSTPLRLVFAAALLGLPLAAAAQAKPASIDLAKTIASMDASSAKFRSAQANVQRDIYTRVTRDTETQHGTTFFKRTPSGTEMGLKITDAGSEKILRYSNGIGDLYSPGTNQVDRFKSAQAEAYLALGFGGKGSDLQKAWTITDQGVEPITVDGKTIPAEKLDLVARDDSIRKDKFSHITMWIDLTRDIPLKQTFFQPNGDIQTSTYSNIRYNQSVDTKPYDIPKNAKVIAH